MSGPGVATGCGAAGGCDGSGGPGGAPRGGAGRAAGQLAGRVAVAGLSVLTVLRLALVVAVPCDLPWDLPGALGLLGALSLGWQVLGSLDPLAGSFGFPWLAVGAGLGVLTGAVGVGAGAAPGVPTAWIATIS